MMFAHAFNEKLAQTKADIFIQVLHKNPNTTLEEVLRVGSKFQLLDIVRTRDLVGVRAATKTKTRIIIVDSDQKVRDFPQRSLNIETKKVSIGSKWTDVGARGAKNPRVGTITRIGKTHATVEWNPGDFVEIALHRFGKHYKRVTP